MREHKQRTHKVRSPNEMAKGTGRNNQRKDKPRSKWWVKDISALKLILTNNNAQDTMAEFFLFFPCLHPSSQDTTKVQRVRLAHYGIKALYTSVGVTWVCAWWQMRAIDSEFVWQTSGHRDSWIEDVLGREDETTTLHGNEQLTPGPSLGRTNLAIDESTDSLFDHQKGFRFQSWLRYKY